MHLTPIVIEQTPRGERSFDIFSRLLQDRIILIFGMIDNNVASSVIAQMLFLTSVDKDKDIYLYINSPGGEVASGFAIFDVMRYIKPDVVTIGMGLCASMGAFACQRNQRKTLRFASYQNDDTPTARWG